MWTANGKNWTLSSALGFGAVCLCLQQWNTTDNNNSLNVNNRSLEFIDKTGLWVHLTHKHFLQQLLSKASNEFVLRAVRLEAVYFLGLDFLNFDWDLACAYRNVRKCTTCKHNSYDIYDMIPKYMCVCYNQIRCIYSLMLD